MKTKKRERRKMGKSTGNDKTCGKKEKGKGKMEEGKGKRKVDEIQKEEINGRDIR